MDSSPWGHKESRLNTTSPTHYGKLFLTYSLKDLGVLVSSLWTVGNGTEA